MIALIDFRGRERKGERGISLPFHLSVFHWLTLIRALIEDQTHNQGVSRRHSNQLSSLAGTRINIFLK